MGEGATHHHCDTAQNRGNNEPQHSRTVPNYTSFSLTSSDEKYCIREREKKNDIHELPIVKWLIIYIWQGFKIKFSEYNALNDVFWMYTVFVRF